MATRCSSVIAGTSHGSNRHTGTSTGASYSEATEVSSSNAVLQARKKMISRYVGSDSPRWSARDCHRKESDGTGEGDTEQDRRQSGAGWSPWLP